MIYVVDKILSLLNLVRLEKAEDRRWEAIKTTLKNNGWLMPGEETALFLSVARKYGYMVVYAGDKNIQKNAERYCNNLAHTKPFPESLALLQHHLSNNVYRSVDNEQRPHYTFMQAYIEAHQCTECHGEGFTGNLQSGEIGATRETCKGCNGTGWRKGDTRLLISTHAWDEVA
jgi:hypothetical protein